MCSIWHRTIPLTLACIVLSSGSALAQADISKNNVVTFGSNLTVTAEEVIDNVTAIGGSVTVLGNGQVTKDAVAIGGDVILKPNA
ncbi:MAG: hypothetical protein WCA35_04440, partial [Kovacikia sp.]